MPRTDQSAINGLATSPVAWPLRAWLVAEVLFAGASSSATLLAPEATESNFAWPIQPVVTAALFGAFYVCALLLMLTGAFIRTWEHVRVIVLPSAAFTAVMLLPTFLHWERFSVKSISFALWLASYVLPPPIFVGCYIWQQRRSQPVGVGVTEPLSALLRAFLFANGAGLAVFAILVMFVPSTLQAIAPFAFTPLTARALAGFIVLAALLQLSMAFENDRLRARLATILLVPLPFVVVSQLVRFASSVQWSNAALWLFLLDLGLVAALSAKLWLNPPTVQRTSA